MSIYAGETAILVIRFRDRDGALQDPTEPVEFFVRKRGVGSTTSDAIPGARVSVGEYRATYTPAEPGKYDYRAETADGLIAEDAFVALSLRT